MRVGIVVKRPAVEHAPRKVEPGKAFSDSYAEIKFYLVHGTD